MAQKTPIKAPVKITENEGKAKALKTAMEQIEKQFGKGAVMRLGENIAMKNRTNSGATTRLTTLMVTSSRFPWT